MKKVSIILAFFLAVALYSCNKLEITLPKGPQGEQGIQGVTGLDGLTAYEVWVKAVGDGVISEWDKSRTEVRDYFLYLKGEKGDKGDKGDQGKSAYDLWKEYVAGGEADDPAGEGKWDPSKNSEKDFYVFLTGPKGADGLIPYIGDNGNWFISDKDSGIPATGPAGADGESGLTAYQVWVDFINGGGDENWPESDTEVYHFFKYLKGEKGDVGATGAKGDDGKTPYIGDNGSWVIGGEDTGIPATGPKGEDGETGLSAYEVWKNDVTSDSGLANPGNGVYDMDEYPLWPQTAVSLGDFYLYLSGKDGKSAYEIWKEYVSGGDVDNPQDPDFKWDPSDDSERDFFVFLTGPKGDDGLFPFIGSNGNWFIGDEDTGIPATGPQGPAGANGNTPYVGENGNWFIGGEDTSIPAKGADGKDGEDGKDGRSAYEIWKADVLSDSGLANPGNGVYDVEDYPLWPTNAVSVSDFWRYLKGKDGVDGTSSGGGLALTDTAYVERVDTKLYNVAPVIALSKKTGDSVEYEYVNPISGGAAFIVTGPGPVIIPDCEVTFTDMSGTITYTKTSDSQGYVYLSREELPSWGEGSPSAKDNPDNIQSGVKPLSFSYGSKVVTDQAKIAATCKVPYRVGLTLVTNGATLRYYATCANYSVYRIVEGVTEKTSFISCREKVNGGNYTQNAMGFWPSVNSSVYTYYRNKGVEILLSRVNGLAGDLASLEEGETVDWFSNINHICGERSYEYTLHRSMVSQGRVKNGKESWFNVGFGDGASPSKVGVYDLMIQYISGEAYSGAGKVLPDYGLSLADSEREVMTPPYYAMPNDVTGSFVWDSGHTTLSLEFSSEASYDLSETTVYYAAGRWDSANTQFYFPATTLGAVYKKPQTSFTVSGKYNGSTVNSTVRFDLFGSLELTDVYDGFRMSVADFVDGSIMVAGFSGKFSYTRGSDKAYAFGCEIPAEERNVTD